MINGVQNTQLGQIPLCHYWSTGNSPWIQSRLWSGWIWCQLVAGIYFRLNINVSWLSVRLKRLPAILPLGFAFPYKTYQTPRTGLLVRKLRKGDGQWLGATGIVSHVTSEFAYGGCVINVEFCPSAYLVLTVNVSATEWFGPRRQDLHVFIFEPQHLPQSQSQGPSSKNSRDVICLRYNVNWNQYLRGARLWYSQAENAA